MKTIYEIQYDLQKDAECELECKRQGMDLVTSANTDPLPVDEVEEQEYQAYLKEQTAEEKRWSALTQAQRDKEAYLEEAYYDYMNSRD